MGSVNMDFFEAVTGISVALALGVLINMAIRRGSPPGRTLGDFFNLYGHWKPLLVVCTIGVLLGLIGQLLS
jgi:hypothetical protein